jgi:hypothetical protein
LTVRGLQLDPDEIAGVADMLADILQRDVAELAGMK